MELETTREGTSPSGLEARAPTDAWSETMDRVIAGICHDLNDRLSSLSGLLELAELDGAIAPDLGVPLRSELDRIEDLIRLLRLLPSETPSEPEPVRLAEVIPAAVALLRRHRGLEDCSVVVDIAADPLVLGDWGELTRLTLLFLALIARSAHAAGSDRIGLRLESSGAMALVIATTTAGVMDLDTALVPIRAAMRRFGGTVEITSGVGREVRSALRLPTRHS